MTQGYKQEAQLRPHTGVVPTNVYINLNSPGDGHHPIIPDKIEVEAEIGDYKPNYRLSTPKSNTGFLEIDK